MLPQPVQSVFSHWFPLGQLVARLGLPQPEGEDQLPTVLNPVGNVSRPTTSCGFPLLTPPTRISQPTASEGTSTRKYFHLLTGWFVTLTLLPAPSNGLSWPLSR